MTTTLRSSGIQMGSSILDVSGSAPSYTCRAWVNFNGTGTVAIRASGNVSSVTDNGTGNYTVNMTTSMPDSGYSAVCGSAQSSGNDMATAYPSSPSAFIVRGFYTAVQSSIERDIINCCAAVFR